MESTILYYKYIFKKNMVITDTLKYVTNIYVQNIFIDFYGKLTVSCIPIFSKFIGEK